jgi:NAD(P)H dehydrogenase (quinone)
MGVAISLPGDEEPAPRIQMLDGFNEGWIEFEGDARKGKLTLKVFWIQ